MDNTPNGGQTPEKKKRQWPWILLFYLFVLVIPVYVANFVPGGDVIMTYALVFGGSFIVSLLVALGFYNRHSELSENEDADEYFDPKSVQVTSEHAEYVYTSKG